MPSLIEISNFNGDLSQIQTLNQTTTPISASNLISRHLLNSNLIIDSTQELATKLNENNITNVGNSSGSSINSSSSSNNQNQMICSSTSSDNCVLEGCSRSSSSIGAILNEVAVNMNEQLGSDLSSSSRRSSLSASNDVDIEKIIIAATSLIEPMMMENDANRRCEKQKTTSSSLFKSRSSSDSSDLLVDEASTNKSKKQKQMQTNVNMKHRTNSYYTRARRSRRILQTPPPPSDEPTSSETNTDLIYDDENEEGEADSNMNNKNADDEVEFDLLTLKSDAAQKPRTNMETFNSLDLDLYDYLSRENLMKLNSKSGGGGIVVGGGGSESNVENANTISTPNNKTNTDNVSSMSFENKLRKWSIITSNECNNSNNINNNNQSNAITNKSKEKLNIPPVFKYLNKNIIDSIFLNEIKHTSNNKQSSEEILLRTKLKYNQSKFMNNRNECSNEAHLKDLTCYISDILNDLISNVVDLVENQALFLDLEQETSSNLNNDENEDLDLNTTEIDTTTATTTTTIRRTTSDECNLIMQNINLINFKEKSLIKTLLSDISNLKNDSYYIMLNENNNNTETNIPLNQSYNLDQKQPESMDDFKEETKNSLLLNSNLLKEDKVNNRLNETNRLSEEDLFDKNNNINILKETKVAKSEKDFPNNYNNHYENLKENSRAKEVCIQQEINEKRNIENNEMIQNKEKNVSILNKNLNDSSLPQTTTTSPSSFSSSSSLLSSMKVVGENEFTHDSNLDNVRISKEIIEELLVCLVKNENSLNPYTPNDKVNMNKNNEIRNENENENEKQINKNIFQSNKNNDLPTSNSNSILKLNSINLNNINTNVNFKIVVKPTEENNEILSKTQTTKLNGENLSEKTNDDNHCNTMNLNCINYDNNKQIFSGDSPCKHLGESNSNREEYCKKIASTQIEKVENHEVEMNNERSSLRSGNKEEDKGEEMKDDTLLNENKKIFQIFQNNNELNDEKKVSQQNENNQNNINKNIMKTPNKEPKTALECILKSDDSNKNIKKVVFKNNDVVLIEECLDDDEEESQLIKRKSDDSVSLFSTNDKPYVATKTSAIKKAATAHNIKFDAISTKSNLNSKLETGANNEEDPYVKAALERFDAFCKSKSTHSLDQTNLTSRVAANIVQQRQKSPFLTRKIINQPNDEPNIKDNIGSFIKRRQARIDPNLKQKNNDTDDEQQKAIKPSSMTTNRSVSESRNKQQPNLFSKSSSDISNSRTENENNLFACSRFIRNTTNNSGDMNNSSKSITSTPLGSSSLAKKFLGSLTPQLEPFVHSPIDEPAEPNSICVSSHSPPLTSTANVKATASTTKPTNKEEKGPKESTFKRRPVTFHKSNAKPFNRFTSASKEKETGEACEKKNTSTSSNTSSSSENSAHSSPTHSTNSTKSKVNIIKLEVVNSKKQQAQNSIENKTKPPLPPSNTTASLVTQSNLPSNGPNSWRSKLKSIYSESPIIDGANLEKTNSTTIKSSSSKTTSSESSSSNKITKPISRVIPLEVKNSKNGTSKIITTATTVLNKTNHEDKATTKSTLTTASKSESPSPPPTPSSSILNSTTPIGDRFRSVSVLRQNETPNSEQVVVTPSSSISSSGGVFQRTRSMGSGFAPSSLLTRTSSSLEYQRQLPSANQPTADSSILHDSFSPENSFENAPPDPIAEKACNNFMFKLMEFQRQHKPYLSMSSSSNVANTAIAANIAVTPTPPPFPTVSNQVSFTSGNLYSGPIVSARTANASIQLNEDNSLESITTTSTTPYMYKPPSYTSTYTPIYHTYNSSQAYDQKYPAYSNINKYSPLVNTTNNINNSIFETVDSNSTISNTSCSSQPRPYVSAIRKRRTLFSDGFDPSSGSENEGAYYSDHLNSSMVGNKNYETSSIQVPRSQTTSVLYTSAENNNNNRPLSIVSEETSASNSNAKNQTNSTLAQSQEVKLNEKISYRSLPRPLIKKSHSISSNKYEAASSLTTALGSSSISNSVSNSNINAINSTAPTSIANKIRSTTPLVKSNGLGSETQVNKNIKCQNEIAIVTTMMPKNRDLGNNASNMSRMRSLDSKNREKLKTNSPPFNSIKKNATGNISNLPPHSPVTSTNVPSCYLYGNGTTSPTNKSKQHHLDGSITDLSVASALNTSLNARRKTNPIVNLTSHAFGSSFPQSTNSPPKNPPSDNGVKVDVFERLSNSSLTNSKRTNSMKNLNNTPTNSGSFLGSKSSFRNNNVSSSSDPDGDKKSSLCSASSTSSSASSHSGASSNDEATNNEDSAFLKSNSSNIHLKSKNSSTNSKTSVFERLYKSNIAAHMSPSSAILTEKENSPSGLKKTMSISSASLASSNGLNTSTASNPGSNRKQCSIPPRQKLNATGKSSTKNLNLNRDQAKSFNKLNNVGSSDESHENNSNENEIGNDSSSESVSENSNDANKSSDVNFIVPLVINDQNKPTNEKDIDIQKEKSNVTPATQSSFLSHKLMDLFKK